MICFAPHPDDETIGVGGHLSILKDLWLVHATDGSPRNLADALANGLRTQDDYALARREELYRMLGIAGVDRDRALQLGFVDQECAFQLVNLATRAAEMIHALAPATILSPAYEGGHPDHDSLAFALHAACRMLGRDRQPVPLIVEYALYHSDSGRLVSGQFLPYPGIPVTTVRLQETATRRKREMLACFVTQRRTLAQFAPDVEAFRVAPPYNFGCAPHSGTLHYELFDWGVTGARWRELAAAAARDLGVPLS